MRWSTTRRRCSTTSTACARDFPKRGVLVQEFLTGAEYSVQLVGNPDQGLRALPILEVDYSQARREAAEDPGL